MKYLKQLHSFMKGVILMYRGFRANFFGFGAFMYNYYEIVYED